MSSIEALRGQVVVGMNRVKEAMNASPGSVQHAQKMGELVELLSNTPGAVDELLKLADRKTRK